MGNTPGSSTRMDAVLLTACWARAGLARAAAWLHNTRPLRLAAFTLAAVHQILLWLIALLLFVETVLTMEPPKEDAGEEGEEVREMRASDQLRKKLQRSKSLVANRRSFFEKN